MLCGMEQENHQVIYRKYRPKNFSEIVGQEHIVQTLKNALVTDKVAHAYLFSGPRGTGKTTMARILAKAVNCANLVNEERVNTKLSIRQSLGEGGLAPADPCNKCEACIDINEGRALDLIEIDAASNRGIDEIRELRDGIKFSPVKLKYKFFIVDECHMLTKEAFNALLKTLEEPPAHAIFVLATTEIHKVPETIISRCQRFDFHKLSLDKIVNRLEQIAKQEKIKIEQQALEMIASNAGGAMRDAESLFGQIMAMGELTKDNKITLEEVQTFLGTTDINAVIEMVNFLAEKNVSAAVAFINKIIEDGYDIEQFSKSLINYLRKVMILKTDPSLAKMAAPELTEEQIKIILGQGQKFSIPELLKIARLLIEAANEMKSSAFAQLPLELAVIEFLGENN